nr:hypothetical protein [uncultured Kingella sp.]
MAFQAAYDGVKNAAGKVNKLVNMVFGIGGTTVGALQLDALIEETTELAANVTQYAVEEGAPIADHIGVESERLSLSGVVSGASVVLFGDSGKSKLVQAKALLRQMHEKREPITIVSGLDFYADYAITNCTIRRGVDEKLDVEMSLIKIRKAQPREADVPPQKASGKAKGKAGETSARKGKTAGKTARKSSVPKTAQPAGKPVSQPTQARQPETQRSRLDSTLFG